MEKYLGEMHEFAAPGKDELRAVPRWEPIANEWSTLVCPGDIPGYPPGEPDLTLLLDHHRQFLCTTRSAGPIWYISVCVY